MADPPKRRWFRFRLRKAIVAFTAVAVWFAWTVDAVKQRERALARLRSDPAYHLVTARWVQEEQIPTIPPYVNPPIVAKVSAVRALLGDVAIQTIYHDPGCAAAEVKHLSKLFPEAEVVAAQARPNPPRTNGRAHSDL